MRRIFYCAKKYSGPVRNLKLVDGCANAQLCRVDTDTWKSAVIAEFFSYDEALSAQRAMNAPNTGKQSPRAAISEVASIIAQDPGLLEQLTDELRSQGIDVGELNGNNRERSAEQLEIQPAEKPTPKDEQTLRHKFRLA